jgi:hypothetical protein
MPMPPTCAPTRNPAFVGGGRGVPGFPVSGGGYAGGGGAPGAPGGTTTGGGVPAPGVSASVTERVSFSLMVTSSVLGA